MQEGIAPPFLTNLQWNNTFVKFYRIANTVYATNRCNDDDVAAATEQGGCCAEPQFFNLLVNSQILFDVGVCCGDVGLGLVIVIVADEVLNEVVREEFLEFTVKLCCERFVVTQYERRALRLSDDVRHRERLSGPCDTQ